MKLENCKNYKDGEPFASRKQIILNLRESLAKRISTNIWGKGFEFTSKNEKVTKKFNELRVESRLDNLFAFCERELSLNGRVILALQKTKDGKVYLNTPVPYYYNGVAKVFMNPQLAVIYTKVVVDANNYVVKSTYTPTKVINELWGDEENKQVRIMDAQEQFDNLGLVEVWEHNLGFIPLFEFFNIPFVQFFYNEFNYLQLADWFGATQFEDAIADTLINLRKELYFNHSRVFIENADQRTMERMKNSLKAISDNSLADNMLGDFIIETDTGVSPKVNFSVGQGDFLKYIDTMDGLIDMYFKFGNASRISEGGSAQKTAGETSQARANLIEFINQKIKNREREITHMLYCWFKAVGVSCDVDDFTFNINGNLAEDNTARIDNMIKEVQIGTLSMVDMISKTQNLTQEQAKEKFDAIKEFNEENDIITTLSIGGGANLSIPETEEEGGAPTKDDPDQDKGENK